MFNATGITTGARHPHFLDEDDKRRKPLPSLLPVIIGLVIVAASLSSYATNDPVPTMIWHVYKKLVAAAKSAGNRL